MIKIFIFNLLFWLVGVQILFMRFLYSLVPKKYCYTNFDTSLWPKSLKLASDITGFIPTNYFLLTFTLMFAIPTIVIFWYNKKKINWIKFGLLLVFCYFVCEYIIGLMGVVDAFAVGSYNCHGISL